jgi:2-oxoglutarate ferredoxin oxidoreductase subunit alpha
MEEHNWKLMRKYQMITKKEVKCEEFMMDDAKLAVVAYGTAARIAKGGVKRARKEGLKVGLIRPITLWPFPSEVIRKWVKSVSLFFVFEMSAGQMVEDVELSLKGTSEVYFYGRPGGVVPTPVELSRIISRQYLQKGL